MRRAASGSASSARTVTWNVHWRAWSTACHGRWRRTCAPARPCPSRAWSCASRWDWPPTPSACTSPTAATTGSWSATTTAASCAASAWARPTSSTARPTRPASTVPRAWPWNGNSCTWPTPATMRCAGSSCARARSTPCAAAAVPAIRSKARCPAERAAHSTIRWPWRLAPTRSISPVPATTASGAVTWVAASCSCAQAPAGWRSPTATPRWPPSPSRPAWPRSSRCCTCATRSVRRCVRCSCAPTWCRPWSGRGPGSSVMPTARARPPTCSIRWGSR